MHSWNDTAFVVEGRIDFSVNKPLAVLIPLSDMLAAVVLADSQQPWTHNGQSARINVSEAELSFDDGKVVIYTVSFQSGCLLTPSQLSAYVKYSAQLAENAHQFIRSGAINWIGSTVKFLGSNIIFDRPDLPSLD